MGYRNENESFAERMIPQDILSEKALLGSILIDPEAYVLVSDFLSSTDFYRETHRQVYEIVEYLVDREETPDIVSICSELDRRNIQLDPNNNYNMSYLSSLINEVPTSNNAEVYGHKIEDAAVRRRLQNVAGAIASAAQTETAEEALTQSEELIYAVSERRNISSYVPIASIVSECLELISQANENKKRLIGLSTGLIDVDRLLKGLRKKALYILAARPRVGKTSLLLAIAFFIASRLGKKVAIFSLEMGKEELTFRMISMLAGVSSDDLQLGWVDDHEWERVSLAMSQVSESGMIIDETGGISIAQLRSRCRQIKAKQGLDIVFVDYLQLLSSSKKDGKSHSNRVEEISDISRGLKNLAKELDIPVFALSQLSRQVESRQIKVPQLSDLRESGSIEQDADCVMFIHREEQYNPETERKNVADLIVAKNRHGSEGEITLSWIGQYTRFGNLEVISGEE